MEAVPAEWYAVLACDMPGVQSALLQRLLQRARERELAACLLSGERGVEPLCAVYHRRCLEPMRAAREAGDLRVVAFAERPGAAGERLRVGELPVGELGPELGAEDPTWNLNEPLDLARAALRSGGGIRA
jgi:molybdopterin-guanine dinucleotide biosynthesis protein A